MGFGLASGSRIALQRLLVAMMGSALVSASTAANVTLAWDPNSEPDIAGYKIHLGITSSTYSNVIDVGNRTSYVLSNLTENTTYFFAATAYNSSGLESDYSREISHTIPATPAPTNALPVAGADRILRFLPSGVKVQVTTLLTNDVDPDGQPVSFTAVDAASAGGGTLTRRSNWIYYIPPEGGTNNDSFTYTITDGLSPPVSGSVAIVVADPGPAPNVTVTEDGGSYTIRFDGTPGVTYRIDYTESVEPPAWQFLGTRTANEFGIFEITDTPPAGSPQRTYRSVAIN